MPVQLIVNHGLPYLLLEAAGPLELADLLGVVTKAAAECAATSHRRCLFDLRGIQNNLALTEQFQLGTYAGESLRRLEKVASVVPAALRTGTCENAARTLGVRFRAFTDIDDAKAWIRT